MEYITRIAAGLHLAAAVYWSGSMLFLVLIASPLVQRIRPPSFQRQFSRRLWHLSHLSMWVAVGVLVVSGAVMLYASGRLDTRLLSLEFWTSGEGTRLGSKFVVAGAVVALSVLHDIGIGPGARLRDPDGDPLRFLTLATWTRWMMALGGLVATLIGAGVLAP